MKLNFTAHSNYYDQPSQADLEAEKKASDIVSSLNIDFVAYYRDGRDIIKNLYSMKIPYYRWGLSLGGYSKSIVYFPHYNKKTKQSTKYNTYIYLNKKGWFINISDTR